MSFRRVTATALLGISSYVTAENLGFKGEILYPQGDKFIVYQNDAILVRYNSEIPDNSIYTWCWDGGNAPTLKARVQDAKAYNSAELITIDYTSSGDCWFNLKSNENPTYGGYNSGGFKVSSGKRATASTFGLNVASSTSSSTSSSATSSSSSSSSSGITSSPSTTTSSSESSSTTKSERTGEVTLEGSAGSTGLATSTLAASASSSSSSATATATGGGSDDSAISGDKSVSSGDGLGTAARIGLGVGIAVGVIGIAALAIAFWMIRRRNMPTHSDTYSDSEELQGDLPKHPWRTDARELASNEELRRGPQHELPG